MQRRRISRNAPDFVTAARSLKRVGEKAARAVYKGTNAVGRTLLKPVDYLIEKDARHQKMKMDTFRRNTRNRQ